MLIAPQGIFVIETKTLSKPRQGDPRVSFAGETLKVAGFVSDRDPIAQVRASSRWLQSSATESTGEKIKARGVVLFLGLVHRAHDPGLAERSPSLGVRARTLTGFLIREPRTLDERQVAMFANHLTRYVRARQDAERRR